MHRKDVPEVVVRRLPLYLQSLVHLQEQGKMVVSSAELGHWAGFNPAQVRKDLSFFGEFGKQGLGYEVAYLRAQLERILQIDREWKVVLVGAGTLGHALAHYDTFGRWHFNLTAVFDSDPEKIGQQIGGLQVQPMSNLSHTVREKGISIAIIAVPAAAAQDVAERLVDSGIQAILNYAPIPLFVPEDIQIATVDPVASLQSMTYYL